MQDLDYIRSVMAPTKSAVKVEAATQYPPQEDPKVRAKQQVLPSFMTTAKPDPKSALQLNDRRLANTDLTTLRNGSGTRKIVADFVRASPDLSAAVTSYVRVGITSGFVSYAKNLDGTFNPEATASLAQIITRMNILNDYTIGFDDSLSIRSVCETWARDLLMTGGMSGELVLNKALLPDKIQPVSTAQIVFYPSTDGRKLRPAQKLSGEEINLDVPTFFMVALDQDTFEAYTVSPVEPAIQGAIFSLDFLNDIRKIVKRAIHPRVVVTLDEEKFKKMAPPEAQSDSQLMASWMNDVLETIRSRVDGLEPEEAMVIFDSIGVEVKDHGNTNLSNEYTVIEKMFNSRLAAGAKVLPTVLGQSNGTSNVASSEVLIFMKYVEGTIWSKLNEMLSKILTLAVRLMGHDVVVEFRYNAIDLRPDLELESFRAMYQSRILDLLSLGLIGDEEASVMLTGHLPPKGFKPLSGTGFRPGTSVMPTGDGYNGASNSGSTMNQNLKPGTPTQPKGGQQKAEGEVIPLNAGRM